MSLRNLITPDQRRKALKRLINEKGLVRIIEAHNGISALIANDAFLEVEYGNQVKRVEFDGLWESSLTDSASKGYPDAEIVGFDSRINNINQLIDVTYKPIIVDGDTGADASNFEYMVKKLEAIGVSAVIIEDKVFPKRNSLSVDARQILEDPEVFANKIERGKKILLTDDFMIIARLESLIAGWGHEDALKRARKYLVAGADGIMIHSKSGSPNDVFRFTEHYENLCHELGFRKPLVCVPTTYNSVREEELKKRGFNVVIYANHLLRVSYKAMENVCKTILLNRRSLEADPYCTPVAKIFEKVGFTDVKEKDAWFASKHSIKAIIPAAGKSREFDKPKALLDINGKALLERQMEVLKRCGIQNFVVIRGFQKEEFKVENVNYYDNENYKDGFVVDSLFHAEEEIVGKFVFMNSDILFSEFIIKNLIDTDLDIVLAIDDTYKYHEHLKDKVLDLVVTKQTFNYPRMIVPPFERQVVRMGHTIDKDLADGEFIGIAYFSEEGARNLRTVYNDCKENHKDRFHEATSFKNAWMSDMLQEMIDRGYKVHYLKIDKGWIEIHHKKDKEIAEKMLRTAKESGG